MKTTGSSKEPGISRNNGSRLASGKNSGSKQASSKNNGSRPSFGKNDGNNEVDGFGDDGVEQIRKSRKSKNLVKSQKLSKSGKSKGEKLKKLPKSRNSPNFDAKNSGPIFLILKARSAFNYLQLAFTKAAILQNFDLECQIWIKTNVLGYAIGDMLS